MADDWENEDFEPPPVPVPSRIGDKWEGEDEDEPVKDSWEDEEAEEKPVEPKIPETKISKKKKLEQKISEKEQKKYQEQSKHLHNGDEEELDLTPEEKLAEKLRKQKLQEESDLLMARETFGLDEVAPMGVLDSLNPSTAEEFLLAKDALVNRIKEWHTRPGYNDFVEGLIKDLCSSLEVDPLKKISLVTKAFFEEKLKLTKPAKGKAKAKKVATLKLDKNNTYYDEDYGGDYDDFM